MEIWTSLRDSLPELQHPLMKVLDWGSVPLGLLYTYFAGRGKLFSWYFAFGSSLILVPLSLKSGYVFDTALHFFYALAAIWGYFTWKQAGADATRTYRSLNNYIFAALSLFIALVSGILAFYADRHIEWADLPYLDAFTTSFSVFGTLLIVYRYRQAWLLFVVIDAAWVFMYARKSLWGVTLLYALYTLVAVYAFQKWKNKANLSASQ